MLTRRTLLWTLPQMALGASAVVGWAVATRRWRPWPKRARAAFVERDGWVPSLQASVPPPPPQRLIDKRPQRILVVGDSMVYNLLPVLADYCLENGHYLHPAIWWGSTSAGWAGSGKLNELLLKHKPTFLLVVLGSSEILGRGIDPIVTRAVHKLLARIGDRKLLWVGPPNWRPDTGINAILERELGKGRYFRSAELALAREEDGIHPDREGGRVWARHIIRWWTEHSDAPILLRPPTRVAKVPGATCYGAAWESMGKG